MEQLKIHLNIDELVLHGFDKDSTAHIGKIIESELARLIADKGLPNTMPLQNHNLDLIDGASITVQPSQKNTRNLGSVIAKSIYSSLGTK